MENVMMRYLDEKDKIIKNLEEKVEKLEEKVEKLEEENFNKKNYSELFDYTINQMINKNDYYLNNITIVDNNKVVKTDSYYKNLSEDLEKSGITDYDFIEKLIFNAIMRKEKGEKNE